MRSRGDNAATEGPTLSRSTLAEAKASVLVELLSTQVSGNDGNNPAKDQIAMQRPDNQACQLFCGF
ncbi:hypothetical protein CBOM_00245 [Ceraceosorus bombacis]|uniref:Uncharacterized protein n=1 Tax=Ceraceosorus bombacis TaxID=401625 RepID=A0A0N7L352_9BASI|nr:hypothetical protein CBOM_00245 [Ceraceosorus bombacis]